MNKKNVLIIILVIMFIIGTVILLIEPIKKQYKIYKLKNINKDITIITETIDDSTYYIGISYYIDIDKKELYQTMYLKTSNTIGEESLVNYKKITDDEIDIIMDIIDNASTNKKQKHAKDSEIYYKVIYGNKAVYTNDEQTNTIILYLIWDLIETKF